MDSSEERTLKTARLRYYLQVAAGLATIIGLGASVYFAIHTDRSKRLDTIYLAKLSLVNPTATSTERVKVSYEGRDVHQLVKVSMRLVNDGTLPIEKRDVERAVTFHFDGATILSAAVVRLAPESIEPSIASEPHLLVINHGLLNPGDYFDFEVLCDGDPGWPSPTFRISGVQERPPSVPADAGDIFRPIYIALPRRYELSVLVIATLAPVLFVVGFAVLALEVATQLFPTRKLSRAIRTATLPSDVSLPSTLAREVFMILPAGANKIAREAVLGLKFDPKTGESASQFLERAERTVRNALRARSRTEWIDWGELSAVIVSLAFAIATGLVMAGTWNSVWRT